MNYIGRLHLAAIFRLSPGWPPVTEPVPTKWLPVIYHRRKSGQSDLPGTFPAIVPGKSHWTAVVWLLRPWRIIKAILLFGKLSCSYTLVLWKGEHCLGWMACCLHCVTLSVTIMTMLEKVLLFSHSDSALGRTCHVSNHNFIINCLFAPAVLWNSRADSFSF